MMNYDDDEDDDVVLLLLLLVVQKKGGVKFQFLCFRSINSIHPLMMAQLIPRINFDMTVYISFNK